MKSRLSFRYLGTLYTRKLDCRTGFAGYQRRYISRWVRSPIEQTRVLWICDLCPFLSFCLCTRLSESVYSFASSPFRIKCYSARVHRWNSYSGDCPGATSVVLFLSLFFFFTRVASPFISTHGRTPVSLPRDPRNTPTNISNPLVSCAWFAHACSCFKLVNVCAYRLSRKTCKSVAVLHALSTILVHRRKIKHKRDRNRNGCGGFDMKREKEIKR